MELSKIKAWLEENAYKFEAHEAAKVDGEFYVLPKAKLDALEMKELEQHSEGER